MNNHSPEMARILIIGSGQLGTRHLQAVATLPGVSEIEVVDPNPASLELGKQRLTEVTEAVPSINYRWLASLDEATPGGSLCIVATQAEGRYQLVSQVADELGYRAFLVEKVVTQSVVEYESLLDFSERQGLSIWVNCQTRTYQFHQQAKMKINPGEPIVFSAMGGNRGLGCNGVHVADLFAFYDGCKQIDSIGAAVDQVLHPSKRGSAVHDLSGTLVGRTTTGSQITISFSGASMAPVHISLVAPEYRFIIDQISNRAWESEIDTDWEWQEMALDENVAVSYMTRSFATQIIETGQCTLPTLREAFSAHRFILDGLQPHFDRIVGKELGRCPVT